MEVAPWGMNSDTYEVAFLIPDLLASGKESIAQEVVDVLGEFNSKYKGKNWFDLSSVPIRALRFWTAMKAIETAGFSTFRISYDEFEQWHVDSSGQRMGDDESQYLMRAINEYGGISVKMMEVLARTIP